MKKYCFEEIPLTVPSDMTEMKSLFSQMLENEEKSVISFINPEIFLEQEKNAELHNYFKPEFINRIDEIINNRLYSDEKFGKKNIKKQIWI